MEEVAILVASVSHTLEVHHDYEHDQHALTGTR